MRLRELSAVLTVGGGTRGEVRLGRVRRLARDGRQGGQSLAGATLAAPPRKTGRPSPEDGERLFRLAELEGNKEYFATEGVPQFLFWRDEITALMTEVFMPCVMEERTCSW